MPEGMAQTCRLSDEEALSAGAIVINREQVGDRIYETHKFAVPLGETLGVGGFVRDITDQIWAQQEIRRSEARLRSVVNVLQHPAETAQDVLDFALDEAVRLTDSEMGFLNTYDEDLRQFRLIALSGSATADRRLSSLRQVADLDQTGLWGEAVRQRKPIMLNDFRTPNPLRRGLPEGHAPLRRFLSVPFNYEGKIVAVVAVANKTTDYTEVDGLQLSLLMDVVWRTLLHRDADAALQQEKENLAAVLAAAPIAMLVFDEHEEVLMANPAAAQAFGKQGSELLHLRCGDLIACVHRQQDPRGCGYSGDCTVCPLTGALRRALSGVGSADLSGEAAFTLRTSPEPVWMRYRVNPVTLYGRPSAVLALDDITNRRRAEEARAQERRLLRTVIDNLPDSVYVKDVRARKMLANRVDLDFMGADTEASVLGKTDLETYPTEVAEPLLVDDRHVLETGEPVRDREEIVTDGTGRKRWLLTSKFPLRDQAGEIVGLVGTGRDITERHQADVERRRLVAQIEAQAHQLQDILETVPEGVLVLQGGGAIVLANPAAQHALAILAPDIDGEVTHLGSRPLGELLTSAPRGSWYEVQAGHHTYEITSRPVLHSIDADRWVVVINDVTQRREVQDHLHQQARLAAVGQLAAGIAHDFNNIMAVIVLQAELVARSGGLTVHDRERLATVNQQAQFATRLIEQILDFSRRSMLSRHPLNLVPQLKEQVMLLQRTLPEHIRVELTYDDEQCTVDADPTRVQQMIVNLAINARDAMPEGGELRLTLARLTLPEGTELSPSGIEAGDWVKLTVSDTGTGIPDDVMEHIFEPFYTTKPPGEGSGLGLAQVYGIVVQHQGHIYVESRAGAGTTFTIYLPALSLAVPEQPPVTSNEIPMGHGELVLVVEDNAPLQQAFQEMLTSWHYAVKTAANGAEALALLNREDVRVDLVLSDVVMPQMGGVALARALRAQGSTVPVILMSGHAQGQDLAALRQEGIHTWLRKPPDLMELGQALASALHHTV